MRALGSKSGGRRTLLALQILLLACGSSTARAEVTGAQVRRAVKAGVRWLKSQQDRDGTWPDRYHAGGETCLATLALLQAGEPLDSPPVAAALHRIRTFENQHVYVVSLKIMALAAADPKKYAAEILDGAKFLIQAQTDSGLWTYTLQRGMFDHSNSQFALLGLHAAAEAGVPVPKGVWNDALAGVLRTQNRDGGWSYRQGGDSYGSMTAAGVSDLIILGNTELVSRERGFRDGAGIGCGVYRANKPLENGMNWLARRFRADSNPGRGDGYLYYWLYAVERCGILSGEQFWGRHDWYREGAEFLVREQGLNGNWTSDLVNTCFAVLFLAKGHKPLLVQKLRWSADAAWSPDRRDLEHLVAYIGDKFGEATAWQSVDLNAPLEQWLAAPLLYFQGHEFPEFTDAHRAKLRAFVENGGTLLAEACCGRDKFREGFVTFAASVFPEAPLRELGPDHAVYHAHYDLEPAGLMGIDVGCRTSVIYAPDDLSCYWEQADIPKSEPALKLGVNIAAYGSGAGRLRDRLDVVTLPEKVEIDTGPAIRDAFRIAQVVYTGDWRPDPLAMVHFAEYLRDELHLDVITNYRQVRLDDKDLYTCPILYMTGHFEFELNAEERAALAAHLRRGGFLFADACCGREAFDRSFRRLLREALPDAALRPIALEHVLFRGEPGFKLDAVHYKPAVLKEEPGLNEPRLWGVEIDGRLAVVYSPYAIGCGVDGHACYGCRGLENEDARRVAANVILYALTH